MDFLTLRIFLLLSETGSFSKTANILHLTQPAVSHQIKTLEHEVNQVLFARKGRSARLTPAGQLFLPYAQQILTLLTEGKTLLAEYGGEYGRLSIGAGTTTIIFRLPDLLQKYKNRFPGIELAIKAGSSREIADLVLGGALDFGLITTPTHPGKIKSVPLYQDEILLVVPASWRPPRSPLTLEDLKDKPLVLFPRTSGFREFLESTFRARQFHPRISLELDTIEGIKQMVRIGMGFSFLPKIAVSSEISAGELKTYPLAGLGDLHRTTYLIYLPDKVWTNAMKGFAGLLSEYHPFSAESL